MQKRNHKAVFQLYKIIVVFIAISTQLLFSATTVTGSSTFSAQFSEYNSSFVLTESISIAAGSNAGEVTLTWGGVTYPGTAVGLTMFFSGEDSTEKTNMAVVFTDDTFAQAVATWTYVDTSTNQGGFELGRFDRSSGDLTASNFHASSVSGSTTFSSTYTDTNDNSSEVGSFIFSGDDDSIGTFTDSGFVYDLFFYDRFFAFAYVDSDDTFGLFYGIFTDSTYSHYIAFDSFKYFDGAVQVGLSEGSGSGSLAVSHSPSYEYSGGTLDFLYSWYEFNSSDFEENSESFQYTTRTDEEITGTTSGDSLPLNTQVIGPILLTSMSISSENFFAVMIFDNANYSNYSGLLVGHDIPTTNGRWGEFAYGSKSSGDLSYSEGESSNTDSDNDTPSDIVVGSNADDTFSGSSTFTVQFSEFNSSTVESETITISAGSGAGEVSLVWGGTTYSGTGSGLVLFLSGEDDIEKTNMVIVFTDETFTQAVASWTFVDTTSNQGGYELRRFDRASGDFMASNFTHSTVTGTTTYSTTYTDMNTNNSEVATYEVTGDGDSVATVVDGTETYNTYFYNQFFALSYIDSDGTYGIYYGLFTDENLNHFIAFDSYKDAGDVVQVGISEGAGTGSLDVSHELAYGYNGSSLTSSYSYHEFDSTAFALNEVVFQYNSRSSEILSGEIVDVPPSPINSLLIGPIIVSTVKVENDEILFSLKIYNDNNYSNYTGHLIGQDIPSLNGRWGEFSQGSKTSGDLSYSTTVTAVQVSISGTPVTEVDRNTAYSFTPAASASDSSSMTFEVQNLPDWASFSTTTGTISGTPTTAGVYSDIIITATSGSSSASLASFSIEVFDTGSTVSISGTPASYAIVGSNYSFTPTAVDTLGASIIFNETNLPDWATFSTETGTITGTPTAEGAHLGVSITASNDNGSDALSYDLSVVGVLVGKETVYITEGGLSQPVIDGGVAPYQISIDSDSNSSLSLYSDTSARDGFLNKLLGLSRGTASISVTDASNQSLSISAIVLEPSSLDVTYELTQLASAEDYKMMTFPINLSNVSGSELFSHLQDQFGTHGQDYILYAYDGSSYSKLTDSSVNTGAGYGYWMGVLSSDNYQVIGSSPSSLGEVQVGINEGWNMIGNPFSTSINTSGIVYYKDGQSIAVESSAQSDLGHVFWGVDSSGEYQALSSMGVGQAAWIYSSIDTTLIFTASSSSVKARLATEVDLENEPQPPARPKSTSFSSSSSGGGGGGGCLLRSTGGSK